MRNASKFGIKKHIFFKLIFFSKNEENCVKNGDKEKNRIGDKGSESSQVCDFFFLIAIKNFEM